MKFSRKFCTFLLAALWVVPLLTSGCAKEKTVPSSEVTPLSYHTPGQSNFLGDNDPIADSHRPNYYEFQAPKEKWMSDHGLSTVFSGGLKKPGETVVIAIHALEREKAASLISQTIRYKLTERKADDSYVRTVDEQNEKIVSIEVPAQKVETEIKLDQETYPSSGSFTLTLSNKGKTSLFYGLGYAFEQKEGDNWTSIPMEANTAVPAIGIKLSAGNSWQQSIGFVNLKPGLYRVSKEIEGIGTSIKKTLFAEFHIQ